MIDDELVRFRRSGISARTERKWKVLRGSLRGLCGYCRLPSCICDCLSAFPGRPVLDSALVESFNQRRSAPLRKVACVQPLHGAHAAVHGASGRGGAQRRSVTQASLGMGSVVAAGRMALKPKYEIQLTGFLGCSSSCPAWSCWLKRRARRCSFAHP